MNKFPDEADAIAGYYGFNANVDKASRIVQTEQTLTAPTNANSERAKDGRRVSGVQLAYLIGRQKFMRVELIVDEGALVPREETELLCNTALEVLRGSSAHEQRVIDMCCGSGNLACAIASCLPAIRVWASDITDDCIAITRRNVVHVGVSDRVVVAQGDLFGGLEGLGLEGSVDAIVCNPPYISRNKLENDCVELLKHEPRVAFDGGPYGISIQQRVVKEALPFLRHGGTLFLEVGLGQESQVKILFDRMKAYENIQLVKNAAGEVRVVSGRKRIKLIN